MTAMEIAAGWLAALAIAALVMKRRERKAWAREAARHEWMRECEQRGRAKQAGAVRHIDPVPMTPGEGQAWEEITGHAGPGFPADIAERIEAQIKRGGAA